MPCDGPVVGLRFFMKAPPQEALKLAGFCQSLTYAGITGITCVGDPGLQGGSRAPLAPFEAAVMRLAAGL